MNITHQPKIINHQRCKADANSFEPKTDFQHSFTETASLSIPTYEHSARKPPKIHQMKPGVEEKPQTIDRASGYGQGEVIKCPFGNRRVKPPKWI